ncbi:hypothetical protein M1B72_09135 [Geomonas paludis]|uniref:Uncharacterized protein n=1 Tax=Geomonas paludis TaxID=2740185 RepID=A0ABY4LMY6_9BACT|nr:hypothetical protein [Geomonas paludis]UPU37853.1 hypothetical protein M1B72_09135 [Geomonas paludis]
MQKLLIIIGVIAVASIGIGYGLENSDSTIPPARTDPVHVAPVRISDSGEDRLAQIPSQLQAARSPAVEARDAADEAADAEWLENASMKDLLQMTAAADFHESTDASHLLPEDEKLLLSELK